MPQKLLQKNIFKKFATRNLSGKKIGKKRLVPLHTEQEDK
jgi:hypothetical protein